METKRHPLSIYRAGAGLSQAELAKRLGIQRWMVNSVETGRRSPSFRLAVRIMEETGGAVTPNDLIATSVEEKSATAPNDFIEVDHDQCA